MLASNMLRAGLLPKTCREGGVVISRPMNSGVLMAAIQLLLWFSTAPSAAIASATTTSILCEPFSLLIFQPRGVSTATARLIASRIASSG